VRGVVVTAFTLSVTLGSDAMRTPEDVALVLRRVATALLDGSTAGTVRQRQHGRRAGAVMTTRLRPGACARCGFRIWTSRKWWRVGSPVCPYWGVIPPDDPADAQR
jgi:hypothetical protein